MYRFDFGFHQLKTYHWRIHILERLSIYKSIGKVLLNEYMVPFEFASILLLVAMIGTVYCLKRKKQRNNMNNILNEIGIETIFLSDTFFVGSLEFIQTKCNYRIYVYQKLC
jgi:hypothetical protein